MKTLITNDAGEAEQLYNDLIPLCNSEIKIKMAQNTNQDENNQLIFFLKNIQNYVNSSDYEEFKKECSLIINKTFRNL